MMRQRSRTPQRPDGLRIPLSGPMTLLTLLTLCSLRAAKRLKLPAGGRFRDTARAWRCRAFGEARYGERKAVVSAPEWEGPSFQTCADAAVCKVFQTSRRREVLSFNHHAEVAALPPAEADALLDRAEADAGIRPHDTVDTVQSARRRSAACVPAATSPRLTTPAPVAALLRAWAAGVIG